MDNVRLIDTHCHLNHQDFVSDLPAVLERAAEAGIAAIIVPGYDLESSERAVQLAAEHDRLYASVGVHPHDAKTLDQPMLDRLRRLARQDKVVAYGEIGLDFHYNLSPPEVQRDAFAVQLRLARELELPLIIHTREAHEDILVILRREGVGPRGGVMHHFSGSADFARQARDLGLLTGIAGPLTYKKNEELRETVRSLPPDSVVVETDAPYAAPAPMRGKRNEPAYVRFVVEKLAELQDVPYDQTAALTTTNAQRLFDLSSA